MILYIGISIVLGIFVAYLVIQIVLPNALQKASEQLILLASQKLGGEKQEIKNDLENKKETIKELIKQLRQELERNSDKLETAERDRIGSFRALKQEIENQSQVTHELSATTESLKKVLSNNQLRGQFGEKVADDLLKMSGFVRGVDYIFNKEQEGTKSRPDFTIFLPNTIKINVDAKFPYSNLQKATETENQAAKEAHIRAFRQDVKNKIKQVTSREYINPEENTVDFVLLFIPNEMIFSFIYDKMNDIWEEAMRQKVVFSGPFGFTAILRLVRQAYDNFRYQKDIQKIIGHIKVFEEEFKKYNTEFETIGTKIKSLSDTYDKVDRTRRNKLITSINKIQLEDSKKEQVTLLD